MYIYIYLESIYVYMNERMNVCMDKYVSNNVCVLDCTDRSKKTPIFF